MGATSFTNGFNNGRKTLRKQVLAVPIQYLDRGGAAPVTSRRVLTCVAPNMPKRSEKRSGQRNNNERSGDDQVKRQQQSNVRQRAELPRVHPFRLVVLSCRYKARASRQ